MKLFIAFFSIIFAALLITSCSSDSTRAANLFCNISSLKADLQKAIDSEDEEKIKEISTEIHEYNSELEEILLSYDGKDNEEDFHEKLISELKNCKNINEEELSEIQKYLKNPKLKNSKAKRKVNEELKENNNSSNPADLFCKIQSMELELKRAEKDEDKLKTRELNSAIQENNRTLEKMFVAIEKSEKKQELFEKLIADLEKCEVLDEQKIAELKDYLSKRFSIE
ncbi:MAG: hypothetical protein JXR58_13345 [Bacteroidales bacterium]|nr:hypothetical protein [Bacteroidales bacterium]